MGKKTKTIKIPEKSTRTISLRGATVTKTDNSRVLEFSFSSEEPVPTWWGREILSHEDGAVDLKRLKNRAQFLFNHKRDNYIGVVEDAWLKEKKGWVKVRFSKNEEAEKVFQDVEDEILSNVSVGYEVNEIRLTKEAQGEPDEYTVTKWCPYEVSIVTIPADITVGVGRSANEKTREIEVELEIEDDEEEENTETDEVLNDDDETENDVDDTSEEDNERSLNKNISVEAANKREITMPQDNTAIVAERERVQAITALGARFKNTELANSLINSDTPLMEARAAFAEKYKPDQEPVARDYSVGLTDKEKGEYSFRRALNAMVNPTNKKFQEEAAFERDVSNAGSKLAGKQAQGFFVPVDILAHKRDYSAGVSTAGGNLVATDLLASSFIDILRKSSVLNRAGVRTLYGLEGNVDIPRQSSTGNVYHVGEGQKPTKSNAGFDQVAMSPKTIAGLSEVTRRLLIQSSVDIENLIRSDIAINLALGIDSAALYGSGSASMPLGLKNTSGIATKSFAAVAPSYLEVVDMETKVAAANADIGTLKYLVSAAGRGALKSTPKASGYPIYIWENGNTVNGYNTEVSNQIADGDYFFGNWSDMLIGFWSGVDLLVDPFSLSDSGGIRVTAFQDYDVAVRHPESFCRGNNSL